METPNRFQTPEYRLADAFTPSIDIARMNDANVKVQASYIEVLLVSEAGFHEPLEDFVAEDGECVIRIMHLVSLKIYLTAGAKMSQSQLVGFMTLFSH